MSTCELCWAEFDNDVELAKHVEMEEAVDWPIGGQDGDIFPDFYMPRCCLCGEYHYGGCG